MEQLACAGNKAYGFNRTPVARDHVGEGRPHLNHRQEARPGHDQQDMETPEAKPSQHEPLGGEHADVDKTIQLLWEPSEPRYVVLLLLWTPAPTWTSPRGSHVRLTIAPLTTVLADSANAQFG